MVAVGGIEEQALVGFRWPAWNIVSLELDGVDEDRGDLEVLGDGPSLVTHPLTGVFVTVVEYEVGDWSFGEAVVVGMNLYVGQVTLREHELVPLGLVGGGGDLHVGEQFLEDVNGKQGGAEPLLDFGPCLDAQAVEVFVAGQVREAQADASPVPAFGGVGLVWRLEPEAGLGEVVLVVAEAPLSAADTEPVGLGPLVSLHFLLFPGDTVLLGELLGGLQVFGDAMAVDPPLQPRFVEFRFGPIGETYRPMTCHDGLVDGKAGELQISFHLGTREFLNAGHVIEIVVGSVWWQVTPGVVVQSE